MNQKDLEMLQATGLRVLVIDENTVFPGEDEDAENAEESEDNEDNEEDDDNTCPTCVGTGEGMYDGASCSNCGGKGFLRPEPDDDCDPPDDFGDDNYCDEEGNRL